MNITAPIAAYSYGVGTAAHGVGWVQAWRIAVSALGATPGGGPTGLLAYAEYRNDTQEYGAQC